MLSRVTFNTLFAYVARTILPPIFFAVGIAACGGPTHLHDPTGEVPIGGFVYQAPGQGWRGQIYPLSAQNVLSRMYQRDGYRFQMQVDWFAPNKPVRDQAELLAWVGAASGRHTEPDAGHGATCARYGYRWKQTLSLGGSTAPWATIEERGLFCIDPSALDHLLHVRIFERFPQDDEVSPFFSDLAEKLLSNVHARVP